MHKILTEKLTLLGQINLLFFGATPIPIYQLFYHRWNCTVPWQRYNPKATLLDHGHCGTYDASYHQSLKLLHV